MTPRAGLARWQRYAFTRSLRAVDPARVESEARRAPAGPLRGMLFSVKDVFPVAGVESCAGSLLLSGRVPDRDPALVAALRAAGAVVLGKGVCAEFGFGVAATDNRLDGRVLHFADPAVSPGGSSGGDAVAVGAGIVDFAVAGDYGGSVRWPAQATGVFGLRLGTAHPLARAAATGRTGLCSPAGVPGPPAAAVSAPVSLQWELETAGLMARSPLTLRAVLAALADVTQDGEGRLHSGPPNSVAAAAPHLGAVPGPGQQGSGPPRGRTLLVTDGTEIAAVRPEVAAALAAARDMARQAGYHLLPAPDEVRDALRDAAGVYAALRTATDDHAALRRLAAGREGLLAAATRAVLDQSPERALAPPVPAVTRLRERASSIQRTVREALRSAGADALLLPLAPSGPTGFDGEVGVAGRLLDASELMAHCRAVSLTGLPVLSLPVRPAGRTSARSWLSVQLVGADRAEDQLCAVAAGLAAGPRGTGA